MKTNKVIVLPYDDAWAPAFEKIKREIEEAVGDWILDIEHVGSTSVAGMSAKPCIDLDVVIRDYTVFENVVTGLQVIGYLHEGDLGIKDREAFQYANKSHLMPHHLYVCPVYSEELHRHVTFRDYLKNNPAAKEKYSRVKEEAAKLYPNDIDKYMEYKSPCIRQLYRMCGLNKSDKENNT